jgi:hypothetical protein
MAKRATIVDVSTGYASGATLDANFDALNEAFDNTLSLDGSTPNAMGADLDMNSNDILNAKDGDFSGNLTVTGGLTLSGATVVPNTLATVPNWEGSWVTATAYVVNDLVRDNGSTYICVEAHTSGTFATDLSGGKWELFAQQGAAGAGTGDMLAANDLSDVDDAPTALANIGGQPLDAALTSISGLTTVTGKMLYTTGSDTYATTDITIQARQLLDDASYSDMRTTLGLGSAAVRDIDNTEDLDVNSTEVLSRGGVKTAIENYAATGVGFETDAYWQNMSSSRANNVAYQNTTGNMIFVYAWQSSIAVSPTNSSYSTITSGTSGTDFGYTWVPIMPDHWYKIPNATLVWELRGAP